MAFIIMHKPAVPRKAAQKRPEQCHDCSCPPLTTAKARGPRLWAVHPDRVHHLVLEQHVVAWVLDRQRRGPMMTAGARLSLLHRRGGSRSRWMANAAGCCWRGSPCAGAPVGTETGTQLCSDARPRTVAVVALAAVCGEEAINRRSIQWLVAWTLISVPTGLWWRRREMRTLQEVITYVHSTWYKS